MKSIRSSLLVSALALAPGLAPAQGSAPDGLAPFGWFASLAGSCWKGAAPDGKSSDTQCYEAQFGRFIAGTITITAAGAEGTRPLSEGRALFAWNATAKHIVFWYWSSGGAYGVGEGFVEGERLRWPQPSREDPKKVTLRSMWTRIDANAYKVAREKLEGKTWKEEFAVTYRRIPK